MNESKRLGKVSRTYRILLALLVTAALAYFAGSHFSDAGSTRHRGLAGVQQVSGRTNTGRAHTLVIYVFSKTDTEYENNMRFFLRWGVSEGDGCDYIFIIQTGEGLKVSGSKSTMPSTLSCQRSTLPPSPPKQPVIHCRSSSLL